MLSQLSTPLILYSPLVGPQCPLEQVPDPVFATRMLGDGIAIDPTSNRLTSPCKGQVTQLARTNHALTVTTPEGAEILLHLGIETVNLNGQGITPKVKQGDSVNPGDVLLEFDADYIALHAKSLVTVMLVANGERFEIIGRSSCLCVTPNTPVLTLMERSETHQLSSVGLTADTESYRPAVIAFPGGIHARPAARIRETARGFSAQLEIGYNGKRANCTSITALIGLGVTQGEQVTVYANGADASSALEAMVQILQTAVEADTESQVPKPVEPLVSGNPSVGVIVGVCASPGIATGTWVHWEALSAQEETSTRTSTPQQEQERLTQALQQVTAQLQQRITQAQSRGAHAEAQIFDAHIALLDDPQLISQAQTMIQQGQSAASAWRAAIAAQSLVISQLADARLAARVTDLRDLEQQVLLALAGNQEEKPLSLPNDAILVAEEFTPSELVFLAQQSVQAICMLGGGPTSHAAILARSYNIPALVALGSNAANLVDGIQVVVDASCGHLETQPSAERIAAVQAQRLQAAQAQQEAMCKATEPAVSLDGRPIEVLANIASIADANLAAKYGADGVGLLRTEFLFSQGDAAPGEEEQSQIYQAITNALQGRPVTIRTVDIGGDKPVTYIPFPREPNPALGLRGIRIENIHPAIVETQLRSLLKISPTSACRILLPMITEVDELVRLRTQIAMLAQSLGVTESVKVGAMIEVPAAALLAGVLAEYADFFSIGTNDLTQYTLAMDRGSPSLAARLDGLHPAVLHLIHATVTGARRHGKPVAVCGALASDIEAVPVLVGLGVDELSVESAKAPVIKQLVRSLDYAQCVREAETLLGLASANAVRAHCRRVWPQ